MGALPQSFAQSLREILPTTSYWCPRRRESCSSARCYGADSPPAHRLLHPPAASEPFCCGTGAPVSKAKAADYTSVVAGVSDSIDVGHWSRNFRGNGASPHVSSNAAVAGSLSVEACRRCAD